jgi:Ribbon-helix-helix protein, copG family
MPFSLRLDSDTEAKIRKLTAATGRSKSEVVREAVAQYVPDRDAVPAPGESAFDRLKPFIGTISTGGANYSKHTHAKYRALLQRKHRARRPR